MKAIKAELAKLELSFPGDLAWDMTYDPTEYMDAVLSRTVRSLAFAFLLSVLAAASAPLAFATGAGSAGSRSLGITLAGGFALLSVAQILRR